MALALASCSDSPTEVSSALEGSYSLRTVNGQNLPVTVSQAGTERLDITAGSLLLNTNGTFSGSIRFRIVIGSASFQQDETASGTWTADGNTITLTSGGEVTTAIWDQSMRQLTATETFEGIGTVVLVFRK